MVQRTCSDLCFLNFFWNFLSGLTLRSKHSVQTWKECAFCVVYCTASFYLLGQVCSSVIHIFLIFADFTSFYSERPIKISSCDCELASSSWNLGIPSLPLTLDDRFHWHQLPLSVQLPVGGQSCQYSPHLCTSWCCDRRGVLQGVGGVPRGHVLGGGVV